MLETLIQSSGGVVTAVLEGIAPNGQPLLRWEGSDGPRPAHAVVWMGQSAPDWRACKGLRAVIAFEQGDEARPVLLGLLDAPPTDVQQAAAPPPMPQEPAPAEPAASDAQAPNPDVLHLESDKELVLQCGKARIALRADGRVTILGGHVVSRSTGVNKIKGGSVHIN